MITGTREARPRTSARHALLVWWTLAHTDGFVECVPGCTGTKITPGACAECIDAEMADRAAW